MTKREPESRSARAGDVRDPRADGSYTEFVDANWTRFLRLARFLSGDDDRGEELLQDCLVKLYPRWRKASVQGDPAAYLRRMLVNGNVDWWRRAKREYPTDAVPEKPAPAQPSLDGRIVDEDLRRALRALPRGQRAVVVLRYCEDLTERETAEALGCTIGTVKSQNARAMAALREHLAPNPLTERTMTQ
jgi:RNA polymerase sigma-70 factor (sigma-E family)